jgi:hypothetical protein
VRVNARRWHPYRHFAPVVSATRLAARVDVAHAPLRAEGRSRCTIPNRTIHPTGPAHPSGSQRPGATSPERASVRLLRLTCPRNRAPVRAGGKGGIGMQWGERGYACAVGVPRATQKAKPAAVGNWLRASRRSVRFPSMKIGRLQRVRCPAVQTPGQA